MPLFLSEARRKRLCGLCYGQRARCFEWFESSRAIDVHQRVELSRQRGMIVMTVAFCFRAIHDADCTLQTREGEALADFAAEVETAQYEGGLVQLMEEALVAV